LSVFPFPYLSSLIFYASFRKIAVHRVTFLISHSLYLKPRKTNPGLATESIDNQLMFRVKEGNLDQMGLLFDRHHRSLYGFFYHNTGLKDESEDLVQTVFMNMIRSRATFTGSHKFETWMYTIARNALKDHYRKNKRSSAFVDTEQVEHQLQDSTTADEKIHRKEEEKLLKRALEQLNEIDRELIILSRYKEMKYQEIAVLLNLSEGAIKVRVHRAVKQLREKYLELSHKTILS
jgi:RNA polymerase sigma factor (sigma-70 family)